MWKLDELPIEIKECPVCKCTETVAQRLNAQIGYRSKQEFPNLHAEFTPFQDPKTITLPYMKGVARYYDDCATCGIRYMTRAEIKELPNLPGLQFAPPGKT